MIRLRKRLEPGAVGKIAEAIGKDASYISRMLSLPDKAGHKRITEDFVDLLNVAFPGWIGANEGFMQVSATAPHQPDASQIGTPIITWDKPEDLPEGEFVIVPRFDIHVACGNGHVVYDEMPMEQGAAFRSDWVKREGLYLRNLATVRAAGDSMEPSIYAGDALLVDRAQTHVQDGRVYLLRFGDEVRVKRLFKRADGGLRIVSDHGGKYPEEVVTAAEMEHIEIIGRVVHKSGAM